MIQSGGKPPPPPKLSTQDGYQPETELPIDGEIWILLVIGLLFGIYILYRSMQATNKAS